MSGPILSVGTDSVTFSTTASDGKVEISMADIGGDQVSEEFSIAAAERIAESIRLSCDQARAQRS